MCSTQQVQFKKSIMQWIVFTFGTRLFVTTIPLTLILSSLVSQQPKWLGGTLAGVFALGEAICSTRITRFIEKSKNPTMIVRFIIVLTLISLPLLTLLITQLEKLWVVSVLITFSVGALTSGIPGITRSYLTNQLISNKKASAIAFDNIINQLCWLSGPLLASISVPIKPTIAFLILIICYALALVLVPQFQKAHNFPAQENNNSPSSTSIILKKIFLPAVLSGLIMCLSAEIDTTLPLLLSSLEISLKITGVIIFCFSISNIFASIIAANYRINRLVQSPRFDIICTLTAIVSFMLLSFQQSLWKIIMAITISGFFLGIVSIIRNVQLTTILQEKEIASGFAIFYSAGGIGYAIGGWTPSLLIKHMNISTTIFTASIIIVLLYILAIILQKRIGINNALSTSMY